MSEDRRKSCLVCAWRANCAKRFSMADETTLHCPDFSEDITLRKHAVDPGVPAGEEAPK